MMNNNTEQNLALQPGVRISVSVSMPTGGGARDPSVLLNETALQLDGRSLSDYRRNRIYDTYDGQNQAFHPDWYSIEFPQTTRFNCIEMTMGIPFRDGGWWTSFAVEVRSHTEEDWQRLERLHISPPYVMDDMRGERRPFETYELMFDAVDARFVRVIGRPGGVAQFTSLARLAVYQRDFMQWNPNRRPEPPIPYVFHLISPQVIWDMSESLMKLTGLSIDFADMECYLDQKRAQEIWQRLRRNYQGEPELWFLIGDVVGWNRWNQQEVLMEQAKYPLSTEPRVHTWFHHTLAIAVAPVVIEGTVLGEITTHPAIVKDRFDWEWHKRYAQKQGFSWPDYVAAVERSPCMSMEQLEGAAALLAMIANQITNLAHRNRSLEAELQKLPAHDRNAYRRRLVEQAIDFMQKQIDLSISVADVARAVALSPAHFCVLFTEEMGCNPSTYLVHLRLERAKKYLVQDRLSVATVSTLLGYSTSYFCRLFKERVGCTPGQYVNQARS